MGIGNREATFIEGRENFTLALIEFEIKPVFKGGLRGLHNFKDIYKADKKCPNSCMYDCKGRQILQILTVNIDDKAVDIGFTEKDIIRIGILFKLHKISILLIITAIAVLAISLNFLDFLISINSNRMYYTYFLFINIVINIPLATWWHLWKWWHCKFNVSQFVLDRYGNKGDEKHDNT